jgi:hypothetical protein
VVQRRSRRGAGRPSTGVLLEPMVVTALRTRVTQAGPAACFVWRVVLEVALPCTHCRAGRRQIGLVQVACRTWVRCLSLTPASCPLASCRCSQGSVISGSMVMIRVWPGSGSAQPPGAVAAGGPSRLAGVKENPAGGPARRVSCGSWVRDGRSRGRRRGPCSSVTVSTRWSSGSPRPPRPGRGPATGRPGRGPPARRAGPPGRPGWPAGTVRVTRPANPEAPSAAAVSAVLAGAESLPRSRSR